MPPEPTINVVSYLRDTASRVPERRALVMPDDTAVTFGQLWQRVCRVSAGLRRAGLEPGDRLVVMIPMSIDLYTVLLAIIQAGAVAVFVDPWMSMRKIAQFAAFAEPAGFAGVGRSHLLRWWQPALRALPLTITTGRRLGWLPARYRLAELLTAAPDERIWTPDSPDAPALITFTSGSSGVPKGANRTHGFLSAQYAALCAEYSYDEADVDMPLFPVFALRNLADGIPSVIPDVDFRRIHTVDGARLLAQIARHGVRTCTASPPFVDRLAAAVQTGGRDPGLRRILTGGAPVSNEMLRRWRAALPDTAITVVYGSTEAEPVASITLEQRLACEGEGYCAGQPVDAIQVRIVRIEKGPIEFTDWEALAPQDGRIGELIVSGRHVSRDYFRNPDAVNENKIIDADGVCWHRMGDTGYMDALGRFWLTGRVHSTILRRGRLLHAQLIEAQIAQLLPGAVRVAALGKDGCLIVVVQGDPVPDAKERVRAAGIPVDEVRFTRRALPLDPRHRSKIDYVLLQQMLTGGRV
jgi:acyl-CoA synthetase (AMP-forming)/AMP-acid ligase II